MDAEQGMDAKMVRTNVTKASPFIIHHVSFIAKE